MWQCWPLLVYTKASCLSLALTNIHKVCITSAPNSLLECAYHTITGIHCLYKAFLLHDTRLLAEIFNPILLSVYWMQALLSLIPFTAISREFCSWFVKQFLSKLFSLWWAFQESLVELKFCQGTDLQTRNKKNSLNSWKKNQGKQGLWPIRAIIIIIVKDSLYMELCILLWSSGGIPSIWPVHLTLKCLSKESATWKFVSMQISTLFN